jgi:hypothetical protein
MLDVFICVDDEGSSLVLALFLWIILSAGPREFAEIKSRNFLEAASRAMKKFIT